MQHPVSIDVHRITSIELGPIHSFPAGRGCEAFCVRHLQIVRDDGVKFAFGLYADDEASLRVLPHEVRLAEETKRADEAEAALALDRERENNARECREVERG